MELRVLRYFIALAEEGSISNASQVLHVTVPTLSRQLSSLETELGRQLYHRGKGGIELTEHGVMLFDYAKSIVDLANKAEADISLPAKSVSGTVHIAAGETQCIYLLAEAMNLVNAEYPEINFKMYSGTSNDLMDGLVRGQFDFMLECEVQHHVDLNVLKLPCKDSWGLLTRKDNPLADRKFIHPEDLLGQPLIMSQQASQVGAIPRWAGPYMEQYDIRASYNLPLNSKFLVKQGVGSALMYEGLIDTPENSELAFIPLLPLLESEQGIIWRKTLPTKQAQVFLDKLRLVVEAKSKECS